MVVLSQNGWPAIAEYGDERLVANPVVPGTDVRLLGGVVAGPGGELLIEFAGEFNRTVERLVQEQGCWGFEPRLIRGSTVVSNHASGTAIDLNAQLHPMGRTGTFTADQRYAIRSLLGSHDDLIRWGGDYSGRVDEMHFELDNAEPAPAAGARAGAGAGAGPPNSQDTDMPLQLVIAEDSKTGAHFAYGPGVFIHVHDPESLAVGQGAGYLSKTVYGTNRRGLDVLAALALAPNVAGQPSAIAT